MQRHANINAMQVQMHSLFFFFLQFLHLSLGLFAQAGVSVLLGDVMLLKKRGESLLMYHSLTERTPHPHLRERY